MEMSTPVTREDLPRLSDADRDALQDDYSVMPIAMDDEQIAYRDSAVARAQRLATFARNEFDPTSEQSWEALDGLWLAALAARNGERRHRDGGADV